MRSRSERTWKGGLTILHNMTHFLQGNNCPCFSLKSLEPVGQVPGCPVLVVACVARKLRPCHMLQPFLN